MCWFFIEFWSERRCLGCVVLLACLDKVPADWLSGLVTFVTMLCAALVLRVREEYLRTDFDERASKA
jgi:hypothetical protein